MKKKYSKEELKIIERVRSQYHYKKMFDDCPIKIRDQVKNSLESCLHLIQEEFGSAFIVSREGDVLWKKNVKEG